MRKIEDKIYNQKYYNIAVLLLVVMLFVLFILRSSDVGELTARVEAIESFIIMMH